MAARTKTPARPLRRGVRVVVRPLHRKRGRAPDAAAMMQLWAGHWLRSCRDMPRQARKLLDHLETDAEKQIHAFRRIMKAWRSLLKLAPDALALDARMVRAEVKELRRSFGAVRDATVVAQTLGRILPKGTNRIEAPADMVAPEQPQLEAVRTKLGWLAAEMERWSVAQESGAFLLTGFRRTCRKARRRLRGDPRRMSLRRLHAWRTSVIDLGYQLGFFLPADLARLKPQAEAAERLRSHLGAVVDLDMARTHLADAIPVGRRAGVEREIDRSIAKQRKKAARFADRLLGERPKVICARLADMLAAREPRRARLV